jgi:hypothetical protein
MGRRGVYIHVFLASALVTGEWSASRLGRLTTGNGWIGGWVGPRAGLDKASMKRKIQFMLI